MKLFLSTACALKLVKDDFQIQISVEEMEDSSEKSFKGVQYPHLRRLEQKDTYLASNGSNITVDDPWRTLEDASSVDTQLWIKQEKSLTESFFEGEASEMISKVSKKLGNAKNFEAIDLPFRNQDYYYFDHAAPGSQNSIYYRTKKDLSFLS